MKSRNTSLIVIVVGIILVITASIFQLQKINFSDFGLDYILVIGFAVFSSILIYVWLQGSIQQNKKLYGTEIQKIEDVTPLLPLRPGASPQSVLEKESRLTKISRIIKILYSRKLYINEVFELRIHLSPKKEFQLTDEELKLKLERIDKIQFEAEEEEPKIKVKLEFSKEEFSSNRVMDVQTLKKDEDNKFVFYLKCLKAEDCMLNVIISYLKEKTDLEKISEKLIIEKTIKTQNGTKVEKTNQIKILPEPSYQEIRRYPLIISVKSLFRMNTTELNVLKIILGPLIVIILVSGAILLGQIQLWEGIVSFLSSLLPLFGIEGFKLATKSESDKNNENE